MKNRGIRLLTAVLLLAGALPLAEAAPKRDCGGKCELDYSLCLQRAANRAAKKTCKVTHKICKRTCQ